MKQAPSLDQAVKHNVISPLVLTATMGGGHCQLCFSDNENEAQRGEVACLRSQSPSVPSWDSDSGFWNFGAHADPPSVISRTPPGLLSSAYTPFLLSSQ